MTSRRKKRGSGGVVTYPKPQDRGGVLIRELIRSFKDLKLPIPLTSHILIAQSAGSDSIALATLLAKYGRRVAPPENMTLLHVNHGWRPSEARKDEQLIRQLGKKLGVKVKVVRLGKSDMAAGASWEEQGRVARKAVFSDLARKLGPQTLVVTAHHADDLAETSLWRLLTGSSDTHGGGILLRHGREFRPLLRVRKQHLREFLIEEGQQWREDQTNHEGRFQRSKMRLELLPVIEKLFPSAVTHLVSSALAHQASSEQDHRVQPFEASILSLAQLKLRRPHWNALRAKLQDENWTGEIHLPQGWKLVREKKPRKI